MKKLYSIALCALTALSLCAKPTHIKPSSITDWKSIGTCDAQGAVYYNMQGVRVDAPENGIYIRRTASKVEKVIIR